MYTKEQKKLDDLLKLKSDSELVLFERIEELETKVDNTVLEVKQTVPVLDSILERVVGTEEKLGEIVLQKGDKGDDYILTEDDKKEIAGFIEVPVVEKVIEKTQIIKEVPIVTEITKVTNEIKEVAIKDTPVETRDKLETLKDEDRLDISAIKGIDKANTLLTDSVLNRAIGIVDQRSSYLVQKVSNLQTKVDTLGGPSIGGTITGGTKGSILFVDPTATIAQDNSNLFYDDTYNGLYLSRSAPTRPAKLLIYRKSTDVQGTVTTTAASGTVTGSGTIFQTQVFVGDKIVVNGETRTVLTVPSDTSLTTDAWTGSNAGQAYSLKFVGAGRVSTTSGSGTVTGSATAFLSDIAVGDTIEVNGETRTVSAIASNTSLTTDNWTASNTTQTYLQLVQRVASVTNAATLGRNITLSKDTVDAGGSALFNGSNTVAQTSTSTNTNTQSTSFGMSVMLGARNTNNWTDTPGLTVQTCNLFTQSGATGTVTNFEGVRARFAYSATGATITNTKLFTTSLNSNSGTMTNTYAYYVDDITTGTQTNTPFAFYNSDANALTYFAGKTGINQTAPTSMLDIVPTSASTIGQIIKAAASQTADLLQFQNSSGTVLASVNASGIITQTNASGNVVNTINSSAGGEGGFVFQANSVNKFELYNNGASHFELYNYTAADYGFKVISATNEFRIKGSLLVEGSAVTFSGNPALATGVITSTNASGYNNQIINGVGEAGIILKLSGTSKWQLYSTAGGFLGFYNYTTASHSLAIAESTGNVGIGTTSPGAKFHVVSNSANVLIGHYPASTIGAIGFGSSIAAGTFALAGNTSQTYLNAPTGGSIQFQVNNVGVGSFSSTKLSVGDGTNYFEINGNYAGSGELLAGAYMSTNTVGNMSFAAANGGSGYKTVLAYYNQTSWLSGLEIANTASGYGNLLLMKSGGSVGIGITPTATLSVNQATLGNSVQTLSSTATNDDPIETVIQGRAATTDATATTILTIPVPASTTVGFQVMVTARRTGGASGTADDAGVFSIQNGYNNLAGTATSLGIDVPGVFYSSTGLLNVTSTGVGSNIEIQVTGEATTNITWHATARVYKTGN